MYMIHYQSGSFCTWLRVQSVSFTSSVDQSSWLVFILTILMLCSLSVIRSCVKCHLSHGLGSDALQLCNHSCAPAVEYVEDITGTTAQTQRQTQQAAVRLNELCCCSELVRGKYCLYPSSEKCPHRFLVDLASDRPQLHISRHPGEEMNSSLHLLLLLLLSLFPPLFDCAEKWEMIFRSQRMKLF